MKTVFDITNADSNVDFKRENSNNQALLHTKFSTRKNSKCRGEAKEACEHFQVQGYLRVPE